MTDPEPPSSEGEEEPLVVLNLSRLPSETELCRPNAENLALAASVILERIQGEKTKVPAAIYGENNERPAIIQRKAVKARDRESYADEQEATELGAAAVAILVARKILNRIVFSRLPKGTGADYKMRVPEKNNSDEYERLECSGIGDGQEATTTRLRSKIRQLARYPEETTGYAVVTNFRPKPVEVRYKRRSQ